MQKLFQEYFLKKAEKVHIFRIKNRQFSRFFIFFGLCGQNYLKSLDGEKKLCYN